MRLYHDFSAFVRWLSNFGNCLVELNYSGSRGRGLDPEKHV